MEIKLFGRRSGFRHPPFFLVLVLRTVLLFLPVKWEAALTAVAPPLPIGIPPPLFVRRLTFLLFLLAIALE